MTQSRQSGGRNPVRMRRQILEAAGRLFARRGFNGVGLRDIAVAAGVSLRMPNHHFGSKDSLFAACGRYALLEKVGFLSLFRDEPVFKDAAEARKALAGKVRAMFFAFYPPTGKRIWYGELVARVMAENRLGAVAALEEGFGPARGWFLATLKQIRPALTPPKFLYWYLSLWGQISFYTMARDAILNRLGKRTYDEAFLRSAADYLAHAMLKQLEN